MTSYVFHSNVLAEYSSPLDSIDLSLDGKVVAFGGRDGVLRLYSMFGDQLMGEFAGHTRTLSRIVFIDSRILAGDFGTLRLYDSIQNRLVWSISPVNNWVYDFSISVSLGQILSVWNDGRFRFYDLNGKEIFCSKICKSMVESVCFHQDAEHCIIGFGTTPKKFSLQDQQFSTRYPRHRQTVKKILFSRDGSLISVSDDGSIIISRYTDGSLVGKITKAHKSVIWDAAITKENLLATVSDDFFLKLWDISTFECVGSVRAHNGSVMGVSASSQDSTLVTCGEDGRVVAWNYTAR